MNAKRLSLGLLALGALSQPALSRAQTPLDARALEAERGGLRTPLGLDIALGARASTFIDGRLILETRLTWTENGAEVSRVVGDPGMVGLPAGPLGPGQTRVLQDLSDRRILSVVVNTADNRTIRQDIDVSLAMPQLAQFQRDVAAARVAAGLHDAVGFALRDAGAP